MFCYVLHSAHQPLIKAKRLIREVSVLSSTLFLYFRCHYCT